MLELVSVPTDDPTDVPGEDSDRNLLDIGAEKRALVSQDSHEGQR